MNQINTISTGNILLKKSHNIEHTAKIQNADACL